MCMLPDMTLLVMMNNIPENEISLVYGQHFRLPTYSGLLLELFIVREKAITYANPRVTGYSLDAKSCWIPEDLRVSCTPRSPKETIINKNRCTIVI